MGLRIDTSNATYVSGPVTFYRNYDNTDSTVIDRVENVEYLNKTLGDIKPADPDRYGYLFLGWALSRDTGQLADGTPLWYAQGNTPRTAFYARWEKLYSVWVVEKVTTGSTTRKEWVKKLNVRKLVEESGNKSWIEIPPNKVVEDEQHCKSWEEI